MSTESITKEFFLSKEGAERLAEMMSNPQPVPEHLLNSRVYEEGVESLKRYVGRLKK